MKVAVRIVIEMTPEQIESLAFEYGLGTDPASIREFTQSYLLEHAQGSTAAEWWTASLRQR